MDNNQRFYLPTHWHYLPPHIRTTVAKMLRHGFTYEGDSDPYGWGGGVGGQNPLSVEPAQDFIREGWDIQIDEGGYFLDASIPHLNATWVENGDLFVIPLSQLDPTIAFIVSINDLTGEELSNDSVLFIKEFAANLLSSWQRSHYISPGQLPLFDLSKFDH